MKNLCKFTAIISIVLLISSCSNKEPKKDRQLVRKQIESAIVHESRINSLKEKAQSGAGSESKNIKELIFNGFAATCIKDNKLMVIVELPTPSEMIKEIGYYCIDEKIWFYRYIEPLKNIDRSLGPFQMNREPFKDIPEEDEDDPLRH